MIGSFVRTNDSILIRTVIDLDQHRRAFDMACPKQRAHEKNLRERGIRRPKTGRSAEASRRVLERGLGGWSEPPRTPSWAAAGRG